MMENRTIGILIVFVLIGFFSFETLGNNGFHIKGQVVEFKSQKPISGVVISCFLNDSLTYRSYSKQNGLFEIDFDFEIDRIEFFYIGKLRIRIINIYNADYETVDLGSIPLIEDPFIFISYEKAPSKKYLKQLRQEKRLITKGTTYENNCGDELKIKFNRKNEYYQYIDFKDLNCKK